MSNTPHRATPEQWAQIESWVEQCAHYSCLVEFRARIEALEAKDREDADAWTAVRRANSELLTKVEALEVRLQPFVRVTGMELSDEMLEKLRKNPGRVELAEPHCAISLAPALVELRRVEALEADMAAAGQAFDMAFAKLTAMKEEEESPPASSETGLLPMIVSPMGLEDELETERIICSAISNGADYVNNMPREVSLQRIQHEPHCVTFARYVQAPLEVAPTSPAPAGSLVVLVADAIDTEPPTQGWRGEARAAIRAVADWLQQFEFIGAVQALREEANR